MVYLHNLSTPQEILRITQGIRVTSDWAGLPDSTLSSDQNWHGQIEDMLTICGILAKTACP